MTHDGSEPRSEPSRNLEVYRMCLSVPWDASEVASVATLVPLLLTLATGPVTASPIP
jgi:hypothetical protein